MKPTYGTVSRNGLIAFGSSLDQIGPFARSVADAALMLDVIGGADPKDSTNLVEETNFNYYDSLMALDQENLRGLKVGVVREFKQDDTDPAVKNSFDAAIAKLKELGAEVGEVSLPSVKLSIATYYIIAAAEASANLARFDGIRYGHSEVTDPNESLDSLYQKTRSKGFGKEVKQRIMLGTFVLSSGYYDAYYNKARKVQEVMRRDFAAAFGKFDLLVGPTSPSVAFPLHSKADSISMYLCDIFTIAANLTGVPAISVPCGFDDKGLPIGLQMFAPHFAEKNLLKGAYIYERNTEWHKKHPNL
jgi:aspartyl-tRNA(Asn)/glutamyl-tRNA(Gln) amidotransferase subunit A